LVLLSAAAFGERFGAVQKFLTDGRCVMSACLYAPPVNTCIHSHYAQLPSPELLLADSIARIDDTPQERVAPAPTVNSTQQSDIVVKYRVKAIEVDNVAVVNGCDW
jgi:hypothetical protein